MEGFHKDLLTGNLNVNNLPELPSKVIKVYVASAVTDTTEERNGLVERVYPKLREYCRQKYGLEFQALDLHWGVPGDAADERADRILRHHEINQCKQNSVGPTFMAVIGQRYGGRPLPANVDARLYEIIKSALQKHRNRETRDAALLDMWYKRDDNCVPPAYKLQKLPVSVTASTENIKIENYNNSNNSSNKIYKGRDDWSDTERALQRLLSKGLDYSVSEGTLDDAVRKTLLASDLETECRMGILDTWDPAGTCLLLQRDIADLKNYINHPNVSNFMEIRYNDLDEKMETDTDAQKHLQELLKENLHGILPTEHVHKFEVLWKHDAGIHKDLHKDYLKDFCDKSCQLLQDLVDRQLKDNQDNSLSGDAGEIQHHWLMCRSRGIPFIGREHHLEVIRSYVTSNSSKMLVLHGEPGSGKTALLSQAAIQCSDWIQGDLINVIRFLGTTPSSFDIRQLLSSLCRQILLALDKDPNSTPNSIKDLQNLFSQLLEKFPENKNLVIFLDSLDILVPQYNAYFLNWLPKQLKENVKIVLTVLPDKHGILDRLQQDLVQEEEYFLEVGAMSVEECTELLSCWLSEAGRCLSPSQESAVQGVFQLCALPLYVKLLAEDAKSWTSHSVISPVMLPTNIKDYLNSFFDGLEFRHGTTLVSKALAYITASTTGLSDCEMEDILSLDDDVLGEVYKDFTPSSRRLPSLFWIRLKSDLSNFLAKKLSEEVSVYFWFHRQFVEATRQRYLADEQARKAVHAVLADYFLGAWYNKKKPFTEAITSNEQKLSLKIDEADRLVTSQPLTFTGADGKTRYNKRKYEQVPRHLYLSGRLQELNNLVLFSYEWIYSKMISLSLEHVLADFVLNPGVEATLVERALRDAQYYLSSDPKALAPELSGRLLSYYPSHPLIRSLIEQCDTSGVKHCGLLPAFSYHQVPGSPLKYSLPCIGKPTQFALIGEQSRYLLVKQSDSSVMQKFDLATGEHVNDIIVSCGEMQVSPNGHYLVLVEHIREKAIKVHDSETGMFLGQLIPSNHIKVEEKATSPWKMTDVSVSDTHLCVTVTTEESTLCIADIATCNILSVIGLGGRSSVCQISPTSSHVFCSSKNTLLCYNLDEYEQEGQNEMEAKPHKLVLSSILSRGYLSNINENKLYVLHLLNGVTDFVYKVDVQEYFQNDWIHNLRLSNSQKMLLLIGQNNLVVYNTTKDAVISHMPRPTDMPKEFKLPKAHQQTEIFYTEAAFSPDDKFVMASIFRNVYVWEADTGRLLTQLQAPVGIVRHLLVPSDRGQIITHMDNAEDIQVWSLGDAISHVGSLDRLTTSVSDIVVTSDNTLAYVTCADSDEVGVLDLHTGHLVDLLTHENPVTSVSISHSSNMAVIATQPQKVNTSNKIWSIKERKMLYEFGSMPAYTIPMTTEDKVICVYQQENRYKSPYELVLFGLNDEEVVDYRWPQPLPFVLCKPFLTPGDKYLVVLTADDFDANNASYVNPTICSISMMDGMSCTRFKLGELIDNVVIRRILHVRPYSQNPYTVIVLFTSEPDDFSSGVGQKYDHCYGFLILDVCSGILCQVIKDFLTPDTSFEKILFNGDASICLDDRSNLFDMATGYYVKTVHPKEAQPSVLAVDGQVAVYYKGSTLSVVRLSDSTFMGRCDVHSEISCVTLCHDDRTVVVGCKDGSLLSYVIINEESDDVKKVLQSVNSRLVASTPKTDFMKARAWDKVNGSDSGPPYSRPTSAVSLGPTDKQLLKKVKPLTRFRPNSDTLLYMNPRSRTCSVM